MLHNCKPFWILSSLFLSCSQRNWDFAVSAFGQHCHSGEKLIVIFVYFFFLVLIAFNHLYYRNESDRLRYVYVCWSGCFGAKSMCLYYSLRVFDCINGSIKMLYCLIIHLACQLTCISNQGQMYYLNKSILIEVANDARVHLILGRHYQQRTDSLIIFPSS